VIGRALAGGATGHPARLHELSRRVRRLSGFLEPRLVEIRRVLAPTGSLYLHLDPREVHYAKILCDSVFGRDCFLNEVIWAYDYGARTKKRWPASTTTSWFT